MPQVNHNYDAEDAGRASRPRVTYTPWVRREAARFPLEFQLVAVSPAESVVDVFDRAPLTPSRNEIETARSSESAAPIGGEGPMRCRFIVKPTRAGQEMLFCSLIPLVTD